jgi:NAD(P)-dependent dehydrogenase (short-subunit alcohol dehydrogenase family)
MVDRGWGRLITTTSHGATGLLGSPIFAAAMGGVISMAKGIANEYRASGVTANCLSPGAMTRLHATSRPMFERLRKEGQITEEDWESYLATPPPEYISPIVTWLCTDEAAEVTGQVFHASGGAVGIWSSYKVERTAYRGDHRTTPPWTLEELDLVIPKALLAQP